MAFVAEVIPAEKKKQFENKEVWYRWGRDWPLKSSEHVTWCVDRERNMFARSVGGINRPGHGGLIWVLCLNDIQVQFRVVEHHYKPSSQQLAEHGVAEANASDWYIFDMDIPPALAHRQPEIQQAIEEVLVAWQAYTLYPNLNRRLNINQFHFTKPPVELMQY